VLERVEDAGAYADLALHAALERSRLPAGDRALATELVYGTLRWRGRLDFALAHALGRGLDEIEPRVANLLRLGAYQLLLLDRVPDAVAVSESVRLARGAGLERAAGLVNAALRRLARERDAIPLPDLEDDPLGHLVHALSIPSWIAARWIAAYGAEDAARLAHASNAQAPRSVRANRRLVSRDALLAELRERFPDAQACRFAPDGIRLGRGSPEQAGRPAHDPAFLAGRMTIQDEASQVVVEWLDPQPGERVLDACAAPGAKATAIAERLGEAGEVIGLDRHPRRLELLARDARRLALANVRIQRADASRPLGGLFAAASFDRILVDAPCSGLGALRRNPDARWRLQPDALERLAAVQRAILLRVRPLLVPGGVLVYSTCTLAPEENEAVIDAFLEEAPEFRRAPAPPPASIAGLVGADGHLRTLPHRHGIDGFFAARLERVR
jgi:16S rRNA (cytosine967-C5)-methyltransferase